MPSDFFDIARVALSGLLVGLCLTLLIYSIHAAVFSKRLRLAYAVTAVVIILLGISIVDRVVDVRWLFLGMLIFGALMTGRIVSPPDGDLAEHLVDLRPLRRVRLYSRLGALFLLGMFLMLPNLILDWVGYSSDVPTNGRVILTLMISIAALIFVRKMFLIPSTFSALLAQVFAWVLLVAVFSVRVSPRFGSSAGSSYTVAYGLTLYLILDRFAVAVSSVRLTNRRFLMIYDRLRPFGFRQSHVKGVRFPSRAAAWLFQIVSSVLLVVVCACLMFLIGSGLFLLATLSGAWTRSTPQSYLSFVLAEPQSLWLVFIANSYFALSVLIFSFLAAKARSASRYFLRLTYDRFRERDPRPPLLLLRSFEDDHVTLPRLGFFQRFLRALPPEVCFDHQLVETFSTIAPVLALGDPEKTDQSEYGAIRQFRPRDDPQWLELVAQHARAAKAIIVVTGSSGGVRKEIALCLNSELARKTLFLASPRKEAGGLELDEILRERVGEIPVAKRAIGYFENAAGRTVFVGASQEMDDYMVCAAAFISQLSEMGSIAVRNKAGAA